MVKTCMSCRQSQVVLTFLHCSKSGGKNKAPIIHYALVGPRIWRMECCHIPVVCVYGDILRPSGVDNAAVVVPVDAWPPSANNGFHSHHFTCEVHGLPKTQSAIQWLCQENCWAWSNVVWSLWFHASYGSCSRIIISTPIQMGSNLYLDES